jgi:hypothetical protein
MNKLNKLLNHSEVDEPGIIKDTVNKILEFDPILFGK